MIQDGSFLALFIPGGHDAMLRLPDNPNMKKMFHWAHNRTLFKLTINHGPAVLLAAGAGNSFIYKKYQIAVLSGETNKQTPMVEYLPRPMPWYFSETLNAFAVSLINTKPDASCHLDLGFSQAPVQKRQINSADWP
ncbi:MAG: hypothetical protein P8L25_04835 [Paracoccaceae bacterium]|nr:hypothetical protein [Paracoccaceae bacterium]